MSDELDRKVAVLESDIKHLTGSVQEMRKEIRDEFVDLHKHMVAQDVKIEEMRRQFDQAEGAKKLLRILWIVAMGIAGLFGYHLKH